MMIGMTETRRQKRLRIHATRKRGGTQLPILKEIAALRETAKNYSSFSKERANHVLQNLTQLKRTQQDYQMSILTGIHDLVFPPKLYSSYLTYYMDTFPIRYRVTKEIVMEQLPHYHLKELMEQHKDIANRASDLAQYITKNAKALQMSHPIADGLQVTKDHLTKLRQAREQIDAELQKSNQASKRQGEDAAFAFIKGLSYQDKGNGGVKNVIFPYEFVVKQPKPSSAILFTELQPAIAPIGLSESNLYVLKEWIRVSLDLIREMKRIHPEAASGALILNETKKPKDITEAQWIQHFITSNIVTTYKITALIAYVYYQLLSEIVKKETTSDRLKQRTNTIDTIRNEMEVRQAELQFYEIYNEWLLLSMTNMTDKTKHDRYRTYSNQIHHYLPLLHEHIRLRTSEYADQKRKQRKGIVLDTPRPSVIPTVRKQNIMDPRARITRAQIERQFQIPAESKALLNKMKY